MNTLDIIVKTIVVAVLGFVSGVAVVLLFAKLVTSFL